jgi:uncharacterized protein (TIGR00251 family)
MPVVTMRVSVKPNSRESSLERREDGTWVARLKSPPVDGKANAELIALVAARFGCRRADVTLKAGAAGRTKLLSVETS